MHPFKQREQQQSTPQRSLSAARGWKAHLHRVTESSRETHKLVNIWANKSNIAAFVDPSAEMQKQYNHAGTVRYLYTYTAFQEWVCLR